MNRLARKYNGKKILMNNTQDDMLEAYVANEKREEEIRDMFY